MHDIERLSPVNLLVTRHIAELEAMKNDKTTAAEVFAAAMRHYREAIGLAHKLQDVIDGRGIPQRDEDGRQIL